METRRVRKTGSSSKVAGVAVVAGAASAAEPGDAMPSILPNVHANTCKQTMSKGDGK